MKTVFDVLSSAIWMSGFALLIMGVAGEAGALDQAAPFFISLAVWGESIGILLIASLNHLCQECPA